MQQVRHIYAEPLKSGWFHVRFHAQFTYYWSNSDVYDPEYINFGINDEESVFSFSSIGNNNRDSKSTPSGYHAQFGISDASDSSVYVRIKNPEKKKGHPFLSVKIFMGVFFSFYGCPFFLFPSMGVLFSFYGCPFFLPFLLWVSFFPFLSVKIFMGVFFSLWVSFFPSFFPRNNGWPDHERVSAGIWCNLIF